MSLWIYHPPQEWDIASIKEQEWIELPWHAMPNLSQIASQQELRKLIEQLMPDVPPETISLRTQVIWQVLTGVHKETILAVVLPRAQKIAFAEITGPYTYVPASVAHPAKHTYPVRWYKRLSPVSAVGRFTSVLLDDSVTLHEANNSSLRKQLMNQLPLGYNRFRKLGWIIAIGFALHLIRMMQHMVEQSF